jgi:hypothetical protein
MQGHEVVGEQGLKEGTKHTPLSYELGGNSGVERWAVLIYIYIYI